MVRSRWQTVSQIFDAAIDLPPHERNNFVHEACGGNSELESEVVRLLSADEKAGSFLELPALSTLPAQNRLAAPALLSAGYIVAGRFQIVRFIGQGGMGQVYEAIDLELKSRIALKAIRPEIASDPLMLSRFRREVQLTRMITHPNVCRTFDIERHAPSSDGETSRTANLTFLTMELLEGETLAQVLSRQGRMNADEALPLVLQMIDALAAAHAVGVIHRDFKPSNVLLVPIAAKTVASGSGSALRLSASRSSGSNLALRAVVTDFGLARIVTSDLPPLETGAVHSTSLTGDQAWMGTLVYMAPEQFERGETSVASDIYSLGLVLFEMITGQRPFADNIAHAEAAKRLKRAAPRASSLVNEVPPAWDAVITRCLSVEAKDRIETVQQVAAVLQEPASVAFLRPVNGAPKEPEPTKRSLRRTVFVGVAILAVVVSLSVAAFRHYWMRAEEAKLSEGSIVLLTDIQNGTSDTRFDSTTELMRRQLLQSPYFSLMDSEKIHKTLGEMLKSDNTTLDPQTAREVAMRNGVRRVVFGVVSRVGNSYVLDLDIEQPDNNPLRFRQHWQNHWTWSMSGSTNAGATGKALPTGFLDAVRDSSDWIRHEIGESSNDIAREDAPPEDITTANWQALSEFTQANQFGSTGQRDNAIRALHNAVAADPNFALAYARLGDVLVSISRYTEGYAAYEKALALGDQRLTRRERDRIRGIYASDTWDYATAEEMFRDYATYYPNDYLGWFYRATPLMMMGRVEEAIESLKKAEAIDPAKMYAPAHIARFDLILGKYDDAARWIQHLRQAGQSDDADLVEGESDFLQGRFQDSQDRFIRLTNSHSPLYVSYGYSLLVRLYAEQGRDKDALAEIDQGLAADRANGDVVHEADKILDRAYIECRLGQYKSCLQSTRISLDLDKSLPGCSVLQPSSAKLRLRPEAMTKPKSRCM